MSQTFTGFWEALTSLEEDSAHLWETLPDWEAHISLFQTWASKFRVLAPKTANFYRIQGEAHAHPSYLLGEALKCALSPKWANFYGIQWETHAHPSYLLGEALKCLLEDLSATLKYDLAFERPRTAQEWPQSASNRRKPASGGEQNNGWTVRTYRFPLLALFG